MISASAAVAAAINARLSPDLRRRLCARAGATIALHFCGRRICLRLGEDGRWRAASSLIDADAEMRWTADGDVRVDGGGALLRDLDEVRRQCAPREWAEDILGADGAEMLRRTAEAAREQLRDLPARCGIAAAPDKVREFVRDVAAFDADLSAAAARLSRLEGGR